jgi:two-component system phosphate regulon sensor histidine kinase PhoR
MDKPSPRASTPDLRGAAQADHGFGRALASLLGRGTRRPSADATAPAAGSLNDPGELFAAALNALPDSVLIYTADASGAAGLRIVASNALAREHLRIRSDNDRLLGALRQPEILEAAEHTLESGASHDLAYETGGAQPRCWRAWTKLLPGQDARRFALLVMRDETKARRLERMRADFLANASHELRTPLASLTGFIETLQGHAKDDAAARERFLRIMASQADRMGRLINDLLSLSRIELNEHVPPSDTCDIGLLVKEAADGFSPLVVTKSVQLAVNAPAAGRAVTIADRDQISQVIQNLIDNAIKYSPTGGVVSVALCEEAPFESDDELIVRSARARDAGGGRLALVSPDRAHAQRYLRLAVTDHGPGIAREHLPRLAERFYRTPGQKSGDGSGTGLGLAIVKHIVNRHRGGLVVESAPGKDTTFVVYLPAQGGEA